MFENLQDLVRRFEELEQELSNPELKSSRLTQISKERASLEDVVVAYRHYTALLSSQEEAKALLGDSDPEMRKMAKEELNELEKAIAEQEELLKVLTLPKDPNDDKNVLLEIRAGTGGEEASLFAADLMRMYTRFADRNRWKTEIMSMTESSSGGIKEVVMLIEGQAVYSRLKFEAGVHRVQRVPTTESQGRIHTSACTVAVLPEADEVTEVPISPSDLEITVCRASGAGGQHVNTTDSAVRIVHKPTGIAVECQDERSQHKNKEKAMKVLRARLLDQKASEQAEAISEDRKLQVGSGDRSERIRTYNFPQGRLTDHRINLTLYKLDQIMEGAIGEVLDALGTHHQTELLKQQGEAS